MKITRRLKDSWFSSAIVAAIVVGEVVAWIVASEFGIRANPVMVAILCTGLVAAIAMVLYDGADIG